MSKFEEIVNAAGAGKSSGRDAAKADASPAEPPKIKMEEFLRDQAKRNQDTIDATYRTKVAKRSTDSRGPEIPDVPLTPKEREKLAKPEQESIEGLKADLDAKRLAFARADIDTSGRWNRLKRVLGLNSKEIKDESVEQKKDAYKAALKAYMNAKRDTLGNITKEQAAELYKEFTVDEATLFLNSKADERARKRKETGEWPEKVMNKYMQVVEWWRKQSLKKKFLVSAGLLTGGVVAGMTFGAVGASLFATLGAGYRVLSGGATGVGLKKMTDALSGKFQQRAASKESAKMLRQEDWLNSLNAKLDESVNAIDKRIEKMESKDLTRRRIATYAGIFVGSGAMAQVLQSSGITGALKEKFSSWWSGGKSGMLRGASGVDQALNEPSRSGILKGGDAMESSAGGKTTKLVGYGTEAEGHEFVNRYPYGKYGPGLYGTEGEGHIPDIQKSPAGDLRAPDAPGKIAEMKAKFLGSHSVQSGGGIERSAQAIIGANPQEFGLDPDDPNLKAKIGKKAHLLGRQMAEKMGFGKNYADFDALARKGVQPGDVITIEKDPFSGEPVINYKGSAFDNISRPKMGGPVEPTGAKPKTGAGILEEGRPRMKKPPIAYDHQPVSKTAGEVRAWGAYDNAVSAEQQVHAANALEAEKLAEEAARTRIQEFRAMGSSLKRVFEGAGYSGYANALNQSMTEFEGILGKGSYFSDVQDANAVAKMNGSMKQLRNLLPVLKSVPGWETKTIGECLFEAMKDSKNTYEIARLVLK